MSAPMAEQKTPVSPAILKGARILLVEDNEVNQAVATCILQEAGHHVVISANGKEALEEMEKRAKAAHGGGQ